MEASELPEGVTTEMVGLLEIGTEAEKFAATYPEEVQEFVHSLAIERGFMRWTNQQVPKDWRYQSYQDLVFDLGVGPVVAPIDLGEFDPMEARNCYANAWSLAITYDDLTYVEGYAQGDFMPVKHAWVEDADGKIIDPTWASIDSMDRATYYGVKFSTEFLTQHVARSGYVSILDGDWRVDLEALRYGFITDDQGVVTARAPKKEE